MHVPAPSNKTTHDVLITVHEAEKDGSRMVTLVFNDKTLKNFSLTSQKFQEQLDHLRISTGADLEILNGSKGPFVMCESSKDLLAQGFLAELIGQFGLKARILFAGGKPRLPV